MIAIGQFDVTQALEAHSLQGIDHLAGLFDGNRSILCSMNEQERRAYLVSVLDRRRGFQPIATGPPD